MNNIFDIMKSYGLEVPTDKKSEFEEKVLANYRTVAEVTGLKNKLENTETERDNLKAQYDTDIKQRDKDIKDLEKKLKDAGTDTDKLSTLQNDLATLQETYNNAKSEYEGKLAKQAYEFAVKEKVAELKFSSNSAKKAFITDAMSEELKMKNGELLGFDIFLDNYKKNDASAFISDDNTDTDSSKDDKPKPQFSGKSNPMNGTQEQSEQAEKPSITFW